MSGSEFVARKGLIIKSIPSTSGSNNFLVIDTSGNTYTQTGVSVITDSKEYNGFVDPNTIAVTYDWTGRTVTLTGTNLNYYWRGNLHTLTSPWTSTGHTATTGTWYLSSSDGVNFTWALNTMWEFSNVLVANVRYGATSETSYGVKETHGLMSPTTHEEFHDTIGTYVDSGCKLTTNSYLENSPLDTSTRPGFDVGVIKDEDISHTISSWPSGTTHTTMYVGPSNVSTFNVAATFPFIFSGTTYMQVNNPTTGIMANGVTARWYNVYQILVPCTTDVSSTKYRMIMLQPQATFTSLAAAQAEDPRGLNLGDFATYNDEYVIYSRITYVTSNGDTNSGKCRISTGGVTYISGNKISQVSVTGFLPSNHRALSNLTWSDSGHIGNINSIAGFGASGEATHITLINGTSGSSGATVEGSSGSSGVTEAGTSGSSGNSSTVDFFSGLIDTVANTEYLLVVNIPFACTIDETTTKSTSGSCSAQFKINGAILDNSPNSVGAGEDIKSHTSTNTVNTGDDVSMQVSANSSCLGMSFTVKLTK